MTFYYAAVLYAVHVQYTVSKQSTHTLSHSLTVHVIMSSLRSPPPPPSPLGATVGAKGQIYKQKMIHTIQTTHHLNTVYDR